LQLFGSADRLLHLRALGLTSPKLVNDRARRVAVFECRNQVCDLSIEPVEPLQ
jgi:hypothetical protein